MKNRYFLSAACFLLLSSFVYHFKNLNKNITGDYVLIPSGKINDQEVKEFYMSSTEITNKQYREFLEELRKNGENEKLRTAMVDTAKWRNFITSNEPYVAHYFQHKAYDKYPVVNISKQAAELYAAWLTEKYNKASGEKVKFALPTEAQWMYAARGGSPTAVYGWKGNSLKNEEKGKWYGGNVGNYRVEQPISGATTGQNANADVTAPVRSFMPNAYGLYNMSGNAAEMLADKSYSKGGSWYSQAGKLRIDASEEYPSGGQPTVGFRLVMEKETK